MPKIPKGKGRELAPEGTHSAVCVQVVDLGTQEKKFKEEVSQVRQIQLGFQLVDEETSEGHNVVVYKTYTYSDSPKANLMKDLKSWLGVKDGDFDMSECIGKAGMVTITHSTSEGNGKTYDNITTITSMPKGMKAKKATEKLNAFFLDEEAFDEDAFDELNEYLKEKIAGSPEYAELTAAKKKPAKAEKAATSTRKKK